MRYSDHYMQYHDIDWFCKIHNTPCHFASAGGILPEPLRERKLLRKLQRDVCLAEYLYEENEISYNEEFLRERFRNDEGARETYLRTFKEMARKGFVSFDRTNLSNSDDNTYHVVCYPQHRDRCVLSTDELTDIGDIVCHYEHLFFIIRISASY